MRFSLENIILFEHQFGTDMLELVARTADILRNSQRRLQPQQQRRHLDQRLLLPVEVNKLKFPTLRRLSINAIKLSEYIRTNILDQDFVFGP